MQSDVIGVQLNIPNGIIHRFLELLSSGALGKKINLEIYEFQIGPSAGR